jgi:hypothetical protein
MIPKKIHQVWIGPHAPPLALMNTWKEKHPDWEYKIWNSHEGFENQAKIDALDEWNGRCDVMRFEILHREGGIIVDADSECVQPLDESFLQHGAWAVWENEQVRPGLIAPGAMGAEPGHPVMRACMDAIRDTPLAGRAWQSVGPGLLTRVAQGRDDLFVYSARTFIPEHFTGAAAPGTDPIYARQHWGSTRGYSKINTRGSAGLWNDAYRGATAVQPYGDITTYLKGAEFLKGLALEDWGTGLGWMRQYCKDVEYVGLDGSRTPFANLVVDLCSYRSHTPGLFMRHVLEHNRRWREILINAVASFQHRMVLVTFSPYQTDQTRILAEHEYTPGSFIPDIGFLREDLVREFSPYLVKEETLKTQTQYQTETVYYLEK